MPPKRTSRRPPADEPSPQLAAHLRRLGLPSVDAYRRWCREHGLPAGTSKSYAELQREREHVRLQAARAAAAARPRVRSPVRALEQALDGVLDPTAVQDAALRAACAELARVGPRRPHRAELPELLRVVHERADFLLASERVGDEQLPFLNGLLRLNERRGQWQRPLDDWRPGSHNRRRQFASLLRHLLAHCPVPAFLDGAWLRRDRAARLHRDLFVHVATGGNPRTARMPVPMGKKVAHWFLQAPEHYTIEGAVRWGQIHALGGSPRLCDAVVATPLGRAFANDEFWQTVLAFFVANPLLDLAHVGPIVDFVEHVKFRPVDVVLPDGRVEQQPPPQPGFRMARRTPEALLRQVEQWHRRLGRGPAAGPASWAASGIGELRHATGGKEAKVFTVRELRSLQALQQEGRAMGHCVVSYARSCAAGHCSIWSLEVLTKAGSEKCLTVEVNRQRAIVQARGEHNRLPEPRELDVLQRWAQQERLVLAHVL